MIWIVLVIVAALVALQWYMEPEKSKFWGRMRFVGWVMSWGLGFEVLLENGMEFGWSTLYLAAFLYSSLWVLSKGWIITGLYNREGA